MIALVLYVAAIVAANVMTDTLGLVPVGFGLVVTAGTFAAGFALLARDFVQRDLGLTAVLAAIAVGGVLSGFLASPGIALASVVAFTAAELVDLGIFTPARTRVGFAAAALASNVVAAPVDTVLFLYLAGFDVTWSAVAGQFIGKVVWATVVPLALYLIGKHALPRQPLDVGRT